jgi:hypothetical protein
MIAAKTGLRKLRLPGLEFPFPYRRVAAKQFYGYHSRSRNKVCNCRQAKLYADHVYANAGRGDIHRQKTERESDFA